MSTTRGGARKAKQFSWHYDPDSRSVVIINENGRGLVYTVQQVAATLAALKASFGTREIPLANNVAKLGDGSEQPGLGTVLYGIEADTTFAQGASYLGVVLEELGYLRWNGRSRGIGWRLTDVPLDAERLERRLREHQAARAS